VRLRGAGLSDEISGTDPLKDGLPLVLCAPLEGAAAREAEEFTSRVVNELSEEFRRRLEAHPLTRERRARGLPFANTVLLRGCGARVAVPSFSELHGLRGFAIAPTAIIAGLAETVGLEVLRVQGATGDYHTNLTNKAEAAIAALGDPTRGFEFGFLHIKAVDDAGHDRDLARKLEWLEKVRSARPELRLRRHSLAHAGQRHGGPLDRAALGKSTQRRLELCSRCHRRPLDARAVWRP
jgi:2,3-diphosphopglycerate-independent phosphoglycerate mutase